MGFDERHDVSIARRQSSRDRQDAALSSPAGVDRDELHGFRQAHVQGIRPFHDHDARVRSYEVVDHAVTSFDGVHFGGAVFQQTIDEAARAAAEIGADPVSR